MPSPLIEELGAPWPMWKGSQLLTAELLWLCVPAPPMYWASKA